MVCSKPTSPFIVVLLLILGFAPLSSQASVYQTLGFGVMSWPEEVEVKDAAGRNHDATAQFYTPTVNYGYRNYRSLEGFLYEAYVLYGSADIQSNKDITYYQKRVPIYGFGAAAGWFLRPQGKQVNIGISLPLQYRHANWTAPPGGDVSKKDVYNLGAVLDARWRLTEHFGIDQRVGAFFGQKSALWMINLEWTL